MKLATTPFLFMLTLEYVHFATCKAEKIDIQDPHDDPEGNRQHYLRYNSVMRRLNPQPLSKVFDNQKVAFDSAAAGVYSAVGGVFRTQCEDFEAVTVSPVAGYNHCGPNLSTTLAKTRCVPNLPDGVDFSLGPFGAGRQEGYFVTATNVAFGSNPTQALGILPGSHHMISMTFSDPNVYSVNFDLFGTYFDRSPINVAIFDRAGVQLFDQNIHSAGRNVGILNNAGTPIGRVQINSGDQFGQPVIDNLCFGSQVLPTDTPSSTPSREPSASPSAAPTTSEPSSIPSISPSGEPSSTPSATPSSEPSATPSATPSRKPSSTPSSIPSFQPSNMPSLVPSTTPSISLAPSHMPSTFPSESPTSNPTAADCTDLPISCDKKGKKVPICIWDTKKEEFKTKCVNPNKDSIVNNSKSSKKYEFIECGCCTSDQQEEEEMPKYCSVSAPRTTAEEFVTLTATLLAGDPAVQTNPKGSKKKSKARN